MKPFNSVRDALKHIESNELLPSEFCLPISDQLQDPMGMNMALILDQILAKGHMPDGFEPKDGYRLYRYKPLKDD